MRLYGLSISSCISDILEGKVRLSQVMEIEAGTSCKTEEDWTNLEEQYKDIYWGENAEEGVKILRELRNTNRITQPLLQGKEKQSPRHGCWKICGFTELDNKPETELRNKIYELKDKIIEHEKQITALEREARYQKILTGPHVWVAEAGTDFEGTDRTRIFGNEAAAKLQCGRWDRERLNPDWTSYYPHPICQEADERYESDLTLEELEVRYLSCDEERANWHPCEYGPQRDYKEIMDDLCATAWAIRTLEEEQKGGGSETSK